MPPNAKIGDLPPGLEFAGQPGADIMTATGPLRVQAEFLTQKIQHPNAVQVFSPLLVMTRDLVPIPLSSPTRRRCANIKSPSLKR
ncbi:MAG: hypothetical protein E7C83_03945 [Corynebacterium sp.]|nr:hypothetical protein [Corynebacterium sp.]MDU2586299.1 hypothetical protein [Corynebacterium sp.]